MKRTRRYGDMKDTGQQWLGDIPSSWGVLKLKRIFSVKKDIAGEEGFTILSVTQKGIRPKDMSDKGQFAQDYSKYQRVCRGDFVMNHMDLLTGWVDVSEYDGVTSPDYRVFINLDPNKYDSSYYRYLFQLCYSARVFYGLGQGVAGFGRWRLPADMFLNFVLPVPSIDEQTAIARYLDDQSAQIDAIIEETKKSIEEYKKWRVAVISEAVTKGLDPNVEMRDSGVEWIGEVPSHWIVAPLTKFLDKIIDYRGKTPVKQSDGVFLVTAKNIKNGHIDYEASKEYVSSEEYDDIMHRGLPEIGDVLFTTEAPLGEVANVDRAHIALAQRIIKFRGIPDKIDNYYLKYWLMSDCFQKDLMTYATGSTAKGIKASKLVLLKIVFSTLSEQKQIVEFLDKKCSMIDEIIVEKNLLISNLESYKRSLIYEAVTGKRKVV